MQNHEVAERNCAEFRNVEVVYVPLAAWHSAT